MSSNTSILNPFMLLAVSVAVLLRWSTSLHNYSGSGKPPMFGDYEAQRHWMEITLGLPAKDWYSNTTDNDLLYWGLDYPPLTAYHSLLCGYISSFINVNFTALHTSRGYESYEHKFFMRASVLITDLLVYIPAIWWYFSLKMSKQDRKFEDESRRRDDGGLNIPGLRIFIALIYPGLIVIDHGHFQYNNISLGLFVVAVAAINNNRLLLGSFFYCLALNYKQMELYHALPFFCYLLGSCFPRKNSQPLYAGLIKLFKIGSVVLFTFFVIWFPFLSSFDLTSQVLHRLFPLARGVFEDKVANIWCAVNIVYKLRNAFTNESMARLCLITTFIAALPSNVDLLFRPNLKKFHIALINSSLAFFLFSFQVHEKSILLVAIPVVLRFSEDALPSFWFLLISVFSMIPLLSKDELLIPALALTLFYVLTVSLTVNFSEQKPTNPTTGHKTLREKKTLLSSIKSQTEDLSTPSIFLWLMFYLSITGCVLLALCSVILSPPARYPDLFPLLISVYSCIHFCLFFIYFNMQQIIPFEPEKKLKSS